MEEMYYAYQGLIFLDLYLWFMYIERQKVGRR